LWFDGKCFDKSNCVDREVVSELGGEETACGSYCVKQEDDGETEGRCDSHCKNIYHYKNSSSGICELIDECNKRKIDNNNSERPCGSGCVKLSITNDILSERCEENCINEEHYDVNEKGICIFKEECSSRKPNSNSLYVCGSSDCYENEESKCSDSCINSNHYHINNKGKCVEYERCEDRKVLVNNENGRACGSGKCYASELSNENDACVESCLNTKFKYNLFIFYFILFFFFLLLNI
jgi:hypothetical protein